MASEFVKDPQAVLDYQWNWAAWLAVGETISSHTVTVATGITLDSSTATGTAVTAWISGGTAGEYRVGCRIVTTAGRTDERGITITVRDR
jgi:hypothetical protein